ncbi:MAG: hypothetical protein NZM12_11950 [Steroidobacteraceae bacterium]|nr:hypothetical protein [Steroidobacteraceae bacterium]MDW8257811.1 hypothetical protein [Gammaproteobacteria bacterium]
MAKFDLDVARPDDVPEVLMNAAEHFAVKAASRSDDAEWWRLISEVLQDAAEELWREMSA